MSTVSPQFLFLLGSVFVDPEPRRATSSEEKPRQFSSLGATKMFATAFALFAQMTSRSNIMEEKKVNVCAGNGKTEKKVEYIVYNSNDSPLVYQRLLLLGESQ